MQRKLDIIRLIVHSPALPSLPAEAFLICQGRKKTAAQVPDSQQQSKASLIGTGLSHVFVVDVSGDPLNPHSKTTRWLSIQLSFLSQLRSLFKLLGLVLLSATYRPVGAKRSDSRADERSFPYKRGPRNPPGPAVLPRASSASENPLFPYLLLFALYALSYRGNISSLLLLFSYPTLLIVGLLRDIELPPVAGAF